MFIPERKAPLFTARSSISVEKKEKRKKAIKSDPTLPIMAERGGWCVDFGARAVLSRRKGSGGAI